MARSVRFWKIFCLILIGAGLIYFAGARRVPLWDRDEPWYAQCSREMLQSGDWVVPRFLGEWRAEKPPVIYWCQAAVMAVAGDTGEAARFPSTVAVLLTALLLGVVVRRFTGDVRAIWTVVIFCTCGLVVAGAKFCITDGVLLLFIFVGQAAMAVLYWAGRAGRRAPGWTAPVFWIALGLGGITKGPQALGMYAFTLAILLVLEGKNWKRGFGWWREFKPLIGLPILAIVVLPWLVMVHERAPGFIATLFLKAKLHASQSMEGHGKPPGYHTILIFGTFYPWSLLLPTMVVTAWKHRRTPMIKFAIASAAGPWLMMELVYTKLPFYVLPAFPGLAFLTADAVVRCIRNKGRDLRNGGFVAMLTVWALATIGLGLAPWASLAAVKADQLPIQQFVVFGVAAVIYAGVVFLRFLHGNVMRAAGTMAGGMGIMMLLLYTALFPRMTFLHLSQRLADDLTQLGAYGADVHVAMIGYDEPSLAFYQGGGARKYDIYYLEIMPRSQWPKWLVIADDEGDWGQLSPRLQGELELRAVETGLDYSRGGKMVRVLILQRR
jgi:4-amino-4-deoxy-L-arabinose transferase-like glycosyltransferase